MKKNLLINSGGALAIALLIFGGGLMLVGSHETPAKSATPPEPEGEKGEAKTPAKEEAPKEAEKKQDPAEIASDLKQLETQYNDFYSRGGFEDARSIALKASVLSHRDDPLWQRRMADTTYLSEVLPANLRAQKSLDIYSALLTSPVPGTDKHWAQYRVCLCLRQLGRWEDALQAINLFSLNYPESERLPELRLYRAQAFFTLGHVDEAQQEIETIIKAPATRDVHASALVELAQMNLERSKNPSSETKINGAVKAEVIDLTRYPADALDTSAHSLTAQTPCVPEEQWGSIRRALEKGDFKEAQRLLNPWVDSGSKLSEDQRARVSIKYANLVRELAQTNPAEVSK